MPLKYKRKRSFSTSRRVKRRYPKGPGLSHRMRRMRGSTYREKIYSFNRGIDFITTSTNLVYTGATSNFAGVTLPAASNFIGFAYAPCLNDVVGDTDFTNLFDQYKIKRVTFRFRLVTNPDASNLQNTTATTNAANVFPLLYLFPDHDDVTVPASINEVRERAGVKCSVVKPNSFVKYSIRPTTVTPITSGTIRNRPQWLDVNSATTPHYGLKGMLCPQTGNVAQPYSVSCEIRISFLCKGVR